LKRVQLQEVKIIRKKLPNRLPNEDEMAESRNGPKAV